MKSTNAIYKTPSSLFSEHDCETPGEYAREAYDRTSCGVSTVFITKGGDGICADDLSKRQDSAKWADRNIIGIKHGTIVEGSDAEYNADPLMFPFTDEQLADTWAACEDFAKENWKGL